MTTATFHPARLHGSAMVPPAKSEAHRALLLAALGQSPCQLHGFVPPLCDDTYAMLSGITALGATYAYTGDTISVVPAPKPIISHTPVQVDVHACAAALRMLIPVFLARGQAVHFEMDKALSLRPLDAFVPIVESIGATMQFLPASSQDTRVTLLVDGHMPCGHYRVDGTKSSQFASGLLIALSHACDLSQNPCVLTLEKPIVSRPYLDMTLHMMCSFCAPFEEKEEGVFSLTPRANTPSEDVRVNADWSQAAVLLCMNALGNGIMLSHLSTQIDNSLQGDVDVLRVLGQMGLRIHRFREDVYAVSPSRARLLPARIDCTSIPDLAPILALTCSQACGTSTLHGVERLRIKECDRLDATLELLQKLGVSAHASEDSTVLTVTGCCGKLKGGFTADAHGDHRMVMFLATAALIADAPITVHGVNALDKSWPSFMETYQSLGGIIS